MKKRKAATAEQKKKYSDTRRNRRHQQKRIRDEAHLRMVAELGVNFNKKGTGICLFERCQVKLSRYNDTSYCSKHHRTAVRNGLIDIKEYL
jgi:hypothetical protein